MTQIQSALKSVRASLQEGVELVAVSKTKPVALLLEAYEAGHVQTNKIKYMAPFVHLVHGVDREKVLKELDKQAKKVSRIIDCLLQVHIAQEETKFGWSVAELEALLPHMSLYPNVRVRGLMGMASNTDDEHQVRREFLDLNDLYKKHAQAQHWDTLSIGMSGDYAIAMECGATHVRIGSAVFGARNYAP